MAGAELEWDFCIQLRLEGCLRGINMLRKKLQSNLSFHHDIRLEELLISGILICLLKVLQFNFLAEVS